MVAMAFDAVAFRMENLASATQRRKPGKKTLEIQLKAKLVQVAGVNTSRVPHRHLVPEAQKDKRWAHNLWLCLEMGA